MAELPASRRRRVPSMLDRRSACHRRPGLPCCVCFRVRNHSGIRKFLGEGTDLRAQRIQDLVGLAPHRLGLIGIGNRAGELAVQERVERVCRVEEVNPADIARTTVAAIDLLNKPGNLQEARSALVEAPIDFSRVQTRLDTNVENSCHGNSGDRVMELSLNFQPRLSRAFDTTAIVSNNPSQRA